MGKTGKRICIVLCSFIFFLVLLEIALRVAGYFYSLKRIAPAESFVSLKKEEGTHVILCLGDSFTFGGDLPFEFSYPFQLEAIFNSADSKNIFKVINGGVCEINSSQLLKNLPNNIKSLKPDTIILLVGASNWFNFVGLNKNDKNIFLKFKDFLYGLRVFKMAKITAMNLEQRFLIAKYKNNASAMARRILYDSYSFRPVIDSNIPLMKELADNRLKKVDCLREVGEKERAAELFNQVMKIDPNSDLYMYQVADFLEHLHRTIGLTGITKYDPEIIAMLFQQKLESSEGKDDKLLMDYFLMFKSIQNSFKKENIESRLKEDLEEIISLCKKNNVKLIIQDYPFPYPLADTVIRDIAAKYSLPLVRNSKAFAELLAKEKKEAYFLTDTHCTPLGYQVMAQDVYNMLLSENITSKLNKEGEEK